MTTGKAGRIADDVIQKLKAQHGDELHQLTAAGLIFIARPPTRADYLRFTEMAADAKKRARAVEMLTRACIVYPEPDDFDALLERKPGLATSLGGELVELAGAVEEVEVKKL